MHMAYSTFHRTYLWAPTASHSASCQCQCHCQTIVPHRCAPHSRTYGTTTRTRAQFYELHSPHVYVCWGDMYVGAARSAWRRPLTIIAKHISPTKRNINEFMLCYCCRCGCRRCRRWLSLLQLLRVRGLQTYILYAGFE